MSQMALFRATEIVDRPARLPRQRLHVHRHGIASRTDDRYVHRLLFSERQREVRAKAVERTPAMAAGIADYVWTVEELLFQTIF